MLKKWKNYQASEVQFGNDENGNRLISLFAKDYQQVMNSEFCPSCKDFEYKFKNFILKLENMKDSKKTGFVLKAMFENITLFGSQEYYNNTNLTDESAILLMETHPKGADLFEVVPEDWEKLKEVPEATKPAKKVEYKEVVTLFEKEFTVEQTQELFKTAGVETKASTVKGLEDKFEKLSEEEIKAIEVVVSEME